MSIRIKIFLCFALLSYFPALAQVDTAWVRVYDGFLGIDEAVDLAVDQSGNSYVTGYSMGWSTYFDYVTIKYSPDGDIQWIRPYNGSDVADFPTDWATDLALDDSGNVYVTGASGDGNSYDYATIKYAPNGDTLWVRRYNGSVNGDDWPYALAVDAVGNVYVTGRSYDTVTSYDYTTIKYSRNGDLLWVKNFSEQVYGWDEGTALAVDNIGNLYVTGSIWGGASYDYGTIKYAPNGDTLWVRRYNGPSNGNDRASALVVDANGNAYVSGSTVTIKYLPNGDTGWVRPDGGILALDKSGNLYIAGGSYKTAKYDPNGNLIWVKYYSGPAYEDWVAGLAVDSLGNAYVTGSRLNDSTCFDYLTVKYSTNGDTLWASRYNRVWGEDWGGCEIAHAIAVDGGGNVYVTGVYAYVVDGRDYLTIKYVQCLAKPGDADGDSTVQISDVVAMVNSLFKGQPALNPSCLGDVNGDGKGLLSDIVYLINYLFKSGPVPVKSRECCL